MSLDANYSRFLLFMFGVVELSWGKKMVNSDDCSDEYNVTGSDYIV